MEKPDSGFRSAWGRAMDENQRKLAELKAALAVETDRAKASQLRHEIAFAEATVRLYERLKLRA